MFDDWIQIGITGAFWGAMGVLLARVLRKLLTVAVADGIRKAKDKEEQ